MSISRLRNLISSPAVRNLAMDLRLVAGHEDYTRFIILGRSRSGSNFLRGLLNSHPAIVAFGEIFQNKESIGWGLSGYPQTARMQELFRTEPVALLQSKVFRRQPNGIQAVGFKIFYYHAQDAEWLPIWDYLRKDSRLRVIHIKRMNVLRTHLSRKLAVQTERWVNVSGETERYGPVELDYDECVADFTQTQSWQRQYDELFRDHPVCVIEYEKLADSTDSEISRVQDFLGVDRFPVAPQTHRQVTQPLHESIANYSELRRRFAGTEWQVFFDE